MRFQHWLWHFLKPNRPRPVSAPRSHVIVSQRGQQVVTTTPMPVIARSVAPAAPPVARPYDWKGE